MREKEELRLKAEAEEKRRKEEEELALANSREATPGSRRGTRRLTFSPEVRGNSRETTPATGKTKR